MKKLLLPLVLTLLLNFGVGALAHGQPVSAGASDIGETAVAVAPTDESRSIKTTDQMNNRNAGSGEEYGYTTRFGETTTDDENVTYNIEIKIIVNVDRNKSDNQTNDGTAPQPIGITDTTPNTRNDGNRTRNGDNTGNRRNRRDRRNDRRGRDTDTTDNNTANEDDTRNYSITGDNTGRVRLDPDGNNPRPQPKTPYSA